MDAQTDKETFLRHAHMKGALFRLRPQMAQEPTCEAEFAQVTQNGATIDQFNGLAIRQGWPVLIDRLCRFTDIRLSTARALWQRMASTGLPRRQDMTARLLQPYIPQLAIYERQQATGTALRYRVRLMGTNTVQFTTEMTGHYIDDIIGPDHLPRWLIVGQTILRYGGPVRLLYRGDSFQKKHVVGEVLAAPLLTTDGRPDLIMAVTTFEGADSWEAVATRTRHQFAEDEAALANPV